MATLVKTNAPFIKTKRSTFSIMMELLAALLVLYIAAVAYNFIQLSPVYGLHAIAIGCLALGSGLVCDVIYYLPYLLNKKTMAQYPVSEKDGKKKLNYKAYGYQLGHSYTYITALILALILPVGTAFYTVVVSTIVGVVVGKLLFGGFGYNIFNPAILGRIFAQLCFGSTLKTTIVTGDPTHEMIQTGASITSTFHANGWITTDFGSVSLVDTLLGNYAGALGETFALIIIILGVYLAVRKIIDWRITVTYVLSFAIASFIMGLVGGLGVSAFEWTLRQVLIGGVLFGGVFCLTDPVTSPTSPSGKIIYALTASFITIAIRYQASAPEGVAYSILFVNMITPLIDMVLKGRSDDKKIAKYSAMGVIFACSLVFAIVFGVNNHVSKDETTEQPSINQTNITEIYEVAEFPSDLEITGGY